MPMPAMTKAQADLKLTLMQADADSMTNQDLYLWLQDSGLPPEIAGRLHELVDKTRKAGDKVIEVGKIIFLKIIEFVKENPNLSVGVAVSAVISVLLSTIPFLGPILAPIAFALGLIAGNRLDNKERGAEASSSSSLVAIAEDVIQITRKFLTLLIDVFTIIFKGVVANAQP